MIAVSYTHLAIFSAVITKWLENKIDDLYTIKMKGNCCTLEYGTTYKVFCKLAETHEQYGDTYEIVYILSLIHILKEQINKLSDVEVKTKVVKKTSMNSNKKSASLIDLGNLLEGGDSN